MRGILLACLLPVILLAPEKPTENVNLTTSGNEFLRVCEPREKQPGVEGLCAGYANGVIDGYDYAFAVIHAQRNETVKGAFCPPEGINRTQQFNIAVKYMKDHPEETHRIAGALIAEAMVAAFPCPQATPQK